MDGQDLDVLSEVQARGAGRISRKSVPLERDAVWMAFFRVSHLFIRFGLIVH